MNEKLFEICNQISADDLECLPNISNVDSDFRLKYATKNSWNSTKYMSVIHHYLTNSYV